MPHNGTTIDTNLYSRQIGTFGMEAMGKLIQLKVLIVGLKGVGVETAKNLILAGPKSVTLCDDRPAEIADLATNFYLTEQHVQSKTSRALASEPQLSELNDYVAVKSAHWPNTDEELHSFLATFSVVVFTDSSFLPQAKLEQINDFCRHQGIGFILGETRGLAGRIFVDYGDKFSCFDSNGEECKSVVLAGIAPASDNPNETLLNVFTHSDKRHPFQEGDHVSFREVIGFPGINGGAPRQIVKVLGPYGFVVQEPGLPAMRGQEYEREGTATQVKVPFEIKFTSLAQLNNLEISKLNLPTPDLAKFGRSESLHAGFIALQAFKDGKGEAPDGRALLPVAQAVHADVEPEVLEQLAAFEQTEIAPMTAFAGGVVAQEIVKFTGKYTPLTQPLYWDMFELFSLRKPSGKARGGRWSHQEGIFGPDGQRDLEKASIFLVGAGALGCEFLKAFALMGLGSTGKVVVTDMDRIETSNLNRQFLFRKEHVGHQKSVTAAAAAHAMNPELKVTALEVRVGPETEEEFNDEFWNGLTAVVNALDNVQARLYVDSRCVWYGKPLLESGTLGTKANVQVVLPRVTQSYGDSQDPPEESIPLCTLKHFPHLIEHTIEWSRDVFQGLFVDGPQEALAFSADPEAYLAKARAEGNAAVQRVKLERIEHLLKLTESGEDGFRNCMQFAADEFIDKFDHQIAQLLHTFPADHKNAEGQLFWSGPKRAPTPLKLNPQDPLHLEFVTAAANLLRSVLGAPAVRQPSEISTALTGVEINKPFVARNVRIKADDSQNVVEGAADDDEALREVSERLVKSFKQIKLTPVEFEKDDDSNFHIDFMHACANLRARNYAIPECDKQRTKMIAGKIIPAVATTTAMVVGLVTCELIKILLSGNQYQLDKFKNGFVNLGLPLWILSEPLPPVQTKSKEYDPVSMGPIRALPEAFTPWDHIDVSLGPDCTVNQLLDHLQTKHGVEAVIISSGNACLFNAFMASHKVRRGKRVFEVIEEVTKKKIPGKKHAVAIEVSGTAVEDGADVVIPTIKFIL